jgi:hypothetical protein
MRFPTTKRQKKTFRVSHMDPGVLHLDFIVLPVGYSYNADIAKAKKSDVIRLGDGSEHEIFSVQKIQTNKPIADLLCRIRYGITLRGCIMRWKMNARLEGHGEKAISEDECLLVVYSIDEYDKG